ncbi:thioredoxin family protein [Streptomyces katsurahamanus]|uniref:Thioredoxin family protein n=1 Tax=Streptomyces katsurahamanus TaxID=2577098 RepID=A0ABW9P494_9ACTN|nr:thioredoxin family protein [Streptomyces katsurahamanus]MQS40014.1 thioredoxin family protein [Streptomyces katsurahamanus]
MTNSLVFFGASWCRPCKATYPIADRVASAMGGELEYVDVETYDTRANDVTAVPTLRVYDEYGDVIAEHRGGATEAQIRALFA